MTAAELLRNSRWVMTFTLSIVAPCSSTGYIRPFLPVSVSSGFSGGLEIGHEFGENQLFLDVDTVLFQGCAQVRIPCRVDWAAGELAAGHGREGGPVGRRVEP